MNAKIENNNFMQPFPRFIKKSFIHSAGFTDLPLNDQMRLLQVSWAEILTLTLAFRSIPFTGRLYFATDFWLDERSAKECGATELYNHVGLLNQCSNN